MTDFGEPVVTDFEHVFRGRLVHSERSSFQKIDVYDHAHFGRILTLDGLVQTTELDEFCYHEMLVHPTLCSRAEAGRVLVIGGGDGGTLRRVLEHGPVEAVMCEIDEAVVRVSLEFIPSLSGGAFDDPRARLLIDDGAAYVRTQESSFDAVIVDSTDPIGAAAVLISPDFYAACHRALRPGGVFVAQTGAPLYQTEEFQTALRNMSTIFDLVEVYMGFVPTYPGVLWSFATGTAGDAVSSTAVDDVAARLESRDISTRFYGPEIHQWAFALPGFVRELIAQALPTSVPRG